MKKFIYLISPNNIYKEFFKELNDVLKTKKVAFFQLRTKYYNENKIIKLAKKIKKITKKNNVKFIINDNLNLAIKCNLDGCHLGQKDGSISISRKKLKKRILGVTCHNSKKLILNAVKHKADYVAIGSFYKSKLKPSATRAKIGTLKWAKKNIKKPIIVIGGINPKNYKKLLIAGANYIAISSYIWNNPTLKPNQSIKLF